MGYHFFAVCDGHGVNGHIVSSYIKNALPSINFNNMPRTLTQTSKGLIIKRSY